MAKHIEQISGFLNTNENLIDLNNKFISKIGLQLPPNSIAILDENEFEIGQTGFLEFDEVYISSVKIKPKENEQIYFIIDYIYEDIE